MFQDTEVHYHWTEQAEPAHTALLLVDLQNDFVHADGWVARQRVPGFLGDTGIDAVLDRSRALLAAARDAGLLTVFIRMIGDDKYLSPALHAQYRRNHGHARVTCVAEDTWGADFAPGLGPDGREREVIIDKHRYSAFIGTRLDQVLRSNGVTTVVVCGVATSGCVESTIRDAFMLDYYVVIASDACGDYEADRHESSLRKLDLSFGWCVPVDDIAGSWQQSADHRARVDTLAAG
jgi:ureidoacrylate peracid hydrolase